MTNLLKRANNEISRTPRLSTAITAVRNSKNPETTDRATVITDKRNLTTVTAVLDLAKSRNSMLSNDSTAVPCLHKNLNRMI